MSDQRLERRRFQFGLRKLLLWMVVVALLLGILKTLGLTTAGLVIAAFWVAITAVVRATLGSVWAHVISAVGGSVLALGFLFAGLITGTSVVLFIILATGIPLLLSSLPGSESPGSTNSCEPNQRPMTDKCRRCRFPLGLRTLLPAVTGIRRRVARQSFFVLVTREPACAPSK